MAKDGTNRGGMRVGSGKKRKPLEEKILEGKSVAFDAENPSKTKIKPPKKYLSAEQKGGGKLYAKQIYKETFEWVIAHGCESFVPKQLIENYAQVTARHIQCEEFLSTYGLIGKHPTTGEPMQSPFFKMSGDYVRLSSQLWYQIYAIVRDNAAKGIINDSANDVMESLLRRVK